MAVKVVVVDAAQLPAGVDFPPLETAKYGWEQYPALTADDIGERCWRADIVVTLSTAIDMASLKKMPRVKLLIAIGEACQHVDQNGLSQLGVELMALPSAQCEEPEQAQILCNRVSRAIDHYISNCKNSGVLT
jgi:lactate dehydrogenase-like 2-hydroxyacid dehydrogenase